MATFSPVLLKQKAKQGRIPVYLRIEAGGTRAYVSLKFSIKANEWSVRYKRVRKSHKLATKYNSIIADAVRDAEDVWLEYRTKKRTPTAKQIKDRLSEGSGDFFRYAEKYVARIRAKNEHTYRNNRSAVRKFASFIRGKFGSQVLPIDEITPELLKDYILHLQEIGNKASSQSISMGVINAIIADARTSGLVGQSFDPFAAIRVPKGKSGRRQILTPGEIGQLRQTDLAEGSLAKLARDLFLFSFYCYGMRFSDVVRLKTENIHGSRIHYTPLKYGGPRSIPLRPEAEEIVSSYTGGEYIFPPLEWPRRKGRKDEASRRVYVNQRINKGLIEACKESGIEKHITFHSARHSFAAAAMSADTSLWNLQRALGHAHPTTTATYTKEWKPSDLDGELESVYTLP